MAEKKPLLVYAAAYETVEAALADLDADRSGSLLVACTYPFLP